MIDVDEDGRPESLPGYTGSFACVYGLYDPRDRQCHYIGVTNNLKRRYAQHLKEGKASKAKSGKLVWLRELSSAGFVPIPRLFEAVPEYAASNKEQEYIMQGQLEGWPLTNVRNFTGRRKDTVSYPVSRENNRLTMTRFLDSIPKIEDNPNIDV